MKFIRYFVDSFTSLVCYLKRGRKLRVNAPSAVKVNLGAGLAVAPGWINIDGSLNAFFSSWPLVVLALCYRVSGSNRYYSLEQYVSILKSGRFIHHDLSYGVPLSDSSVDYIFSSHFFEHLFRADALRLLVDAHRVLKSNGVIRLSIPDLAYAIRMYSEGRKEKMLSDYFFVDDLGSYLARHKYMYDFELIFKLLAEAGFREIVRRNYREGIVPDLGLLDNRPEDSLFVEAVK